MLNKDERDEYEREDALARATDSRRGRMMTNVERECFAQISELEDVLRTAEDMVKPIVEVWKGRVARLETRLAKAEKLAEAARGFEKTVKTLHLPLGVISDVGAAWRPVSEALADFEEKDR